MNKNDKISLKSCNTNNENNVFISLPKPCIDLLLEKLGMTSKNLYKKFNMALLLKDFNWSLYSAIAIKEKVDRKLITDVINMSFLGVVTSASCFENTKLKKNKELDL